jgi:hypothetical protein
MSPLPRSLELIRQQLIQSLSHANNPLRHAFHLTFPLLVQFLTSKDGIRDPSSMQRRVRIHRPNHNLQLTIHSLLLLRILSRQRERTHTLSVQSHVLRKGLRERNLVTLGDEVSDSKGISGGGARGESLVGHVEEGEQFFGGYYIGDLSPLGLGRVHACRVVCTSVQEDNGAFGGILSKSKEKFNIPQPLNYKYVTHLQIILQTFKVQSDSFLVKVTVPSDFKTRVLEDRRVVAPRWNGKVYDFRIRIMPSQKGASNAERTCARDGLGDGDLWHRESVYRLSEEM